MNIDAYRAMLAAEKAYLLANDWEERRPDEWHHPRLGPDRGIRGGHAVNTQKQEDRVSIRFYQVPKELIHPPDPVEGARVSTERNPSDADTPLQRL
jgi:hypothetical protein